MSFCKFQKVKIEIYHDITTESEALKNLGNFMVNVMNTNDGDCSLDLTVDEDSFSIEDTDDLSETLNNLSNYAHIEIIAEYEYFEGDLHNILEELAKTEKINVLMFYSSDFDAETYTFGDVTEVPMKTEDVEDGCWETDAIPKSVIKYASNKFNENNIDEIDIETELEKIFSVELYDILFDDVDYDYAEATYENNQVVLEIDTHIWRELDSDTFNTMTKAFIKAKNKLAKKNIDYYVGTDTATTINLIDFNTMTCAKLDFGNNVFSINGFKFGNISTNS